MTTRDEKIALSFEAKPTESGACSVSGRSALGHWMWQASFDDTVRFGSWQPVPATEPWIVLKCLERLLTDRVDTSRAVLEIFLDFLWKKTTMVDSILSAYLKAMSL